MDFIMSEINAEKSSGKIPENLRDALHRKEAVCAALENLSANNCGDYQSEIARLSSEYAASGDLPPEFAELLDKRFNDAVKTARDGEAAFLERQQQIAGLASEVDALLAAGELATLAEVEKLEKRITELTGDSALIARLEPLKSQLQAEEAAVIAAETAVNALADELEQLTAAENIAPLHERKSAIEAAFAELVNIPRKAAQRYQDAHRKASIKIAQHYETLDLARWESYTRKLDLCAELEKLLALGDDAMNQASKKLNEIREQWKTLGAVPKEKSEEINPRYLELTRQLQHKVDEYFARKRQTQKLAAAEKEKLCIQAEELSRSTEWKATAEKMRDLQAQWKQLPRAGSHENDLFQRFHAAADAFFTARKAAFDARDKRFQELEERKKALIAEAENLTDARRARALRDEYRAIGFCGKNEQELYNRFNTAVNAFFNQRREVNASKIDEVKTLLAEVETFFAAPADALPRVREIREKLRELSCRDTRSMEQTVLGKFDAALNEFRKQQQLEREANSDAVALALAAGLDNWRSGAAVELPPPETLAAYPKLQNFAAALTAAAAGDDKAADKVEKLIAAARSEREKICTELEKLAGTSSNEPETLDLAQELQFAMLGNFGKSGAAASAKAADPHRLCSDFAACGIVPAAELQEFQNRFNAAKNIIFGK